MAAAKVSPHSLSYVGSLLCFLFVFWKAQASAHSPLLRHSFPRYTYNTNSHKHARACIRVPASVRISSSSTYTVDSIAGFVNRLCKRHSRQLFANLAWLWRVVVLSEWLVLLFCGLFCKVLFLGFSFSLLQSSSRAMVLGGCPQCIHTWCRKLLLCGFFLVTRSAWCSKQLFRVSEFFVLQAGFWGTLFQTVLFDFLRRGQWCFFFFSSHAAVVVVQRSAILFPQSH